MELVLLNKYNPNHPDYDELEAIVMFLEINKGNYLNIEKEKSSLCSRMRPTKLITNPSITYLTKETDNEKERKCQDPLDYTDNGISPNQGNENNVTSSFSTSYLNKELDTVKKDRDWQDQIDCSDDEFSPKRKISLPEDKVTTNPSTIYSNKTLEKEDRDWLDFLDSSDDESSELIIDLPKEEHKVEVSTKPLITYLNQEPDKEKEMEYQDWLDFSDDEPSPNLIMDIPEDNSFLDDTLSSSEEDITEISKASTENEMIEEDITIEGQENEQKMVSSLKQNFTCDKCCTSYKSLIKLSLHKKIKHNIEDYPHRCSKCDFQTPNRKLLVNHEKSHILNSFVCDSCEKAFVKENFYQAHIKKCPKNSPNINTTNRMPLSENQQTNINSDVEMEDVEISLQKLSPLKGYVCPHCRRSFIRKVSYKKHVLSHIRFTCKVPDCNASFAYLEQLREHRKSHKSLI